MLSSYLISLVVIEFTMLCYWAANKFEKHQHSTTGTFSACYLQPGCYVLFTFLILSHFVNICNDTVLFYKDWLLRLDF